MTEEEKYYTPKNDNEELTEDTQSKDYQENAKIHRITAKAVDTIFD